MTSDEDFLDAFEMSAVDLSSTEIPAEVINRVDASSARELCVIPIRFDAGVLTVAMSDPLDLAPLNELHFKLNCKVRGAIASKAQITAAIKKYYGPG
jgi:type IV pilus assembly protein PilB